MLAQKIFEIRIFNLPKNEFQTTKFPDFWYSVANSLTFRGLFQIPRLFQVFQAFQDSGNPVLILNVYIFGEDSFIDFVWRNVPGTFRGRDFVA